MDSLIPKYLLPAHLSQRGRLKSQFVVSTNGNNGFIYRPPSCGILKCIDTACGGTAKLLGGSKVSHATPHKSKCSGRTKEVAQQVVATLAHGDRGMRPWLAKVSGMPSDMKEAMWIHANVSFQPSIKKRWRKKVGIPS